MSHRPLLRSALATALSLGLVQGADAHDAVAPKGKEKCYGVALQGENDCANLAGTHDCAGLAESDRLGDEWRLVPKGSCAQLGGQSEAQARRAVTAPATVAPSPNPRSAALPAVAASAASAPQTASAASPASPASR